MTEVTIEIDEREAQISGPYAMMVEEIEQQSGQPMTEALAAGLEQVIESNYQQMQQQQRQQAPAAEPETEE